MVVNISFKLVQEWFVSRIDCVLDCFCGSYPTVTTILLKALDVWYFDPFVTSPVLRLITELVLNRSQVKFVCFVLM